MPLNAIEVRSRARRIAKTYGKLGLVIVDYLQLMQASTAFPIVTPVTSGMS